HRPKVDPGLPAYGVPAPSSAPVISPAAMQRPPRRPWLAPVLVAAAALLVLGGGWWLMNRRAPSATVVEGGATVVGGGLGEVAITAVPGTFTLYVDDRFRPANPVRSGFRMELPAGVHRFRLEATGFEPLVRDQVVPEGGLV